MTRITNRIALLLIAAGVALGLLACTPLPDLTPEERAAYNARADARIAAVEQMIAIVRVNHGDVIRVRPEIAAAARTACLVGLVGAAARGTDPARLARLQRACELLDDVLSRPVVSMPPRKPVGESLESTND